MSNKRRRHHHHHHGSLLAYLKKLGNPGIGTMMGQTLDVYSATPCDGIDATPGAYFPKLFVNAPGPNTGLTPAIIDLFLDVNSPYGGHERDNAPPNDVQSLAQAAIAAGCVVKMNFGPQNPAGFGNNPWSDVLMGGTATNTAYLAALAADAAILAAIPGPVILCFCGEMNVGGGYDAGQNWAAINACTEAEYVKLWQLTWSYFSQQGLTNLLWCFESNSGVGNYTWGFPGNALCDVVAFDTFTQQASYTDPTGYAARTALGLPFFIGSTGLSYDQSFNNFTQNDYTEVVQTCLSAYPKAFGIVMWCQDTAMNVQNGALECLSAPGLLNLADIPRFKRAR